MLFYFVAVFKTYVESNPDIAPPCTAPTALKEVKCNLVQALRLCTGRTAIGGSRGIALPFHDYGTRRG